MKVSDVGQLDLNDDLFIIHKGISCVITALDFDENLIGYAKDGKNYWARCENSDLMIKAERPPLGLKPKKFVDEERFIEVCRVISSYYNEGKPISIEWIEEYNELLTEDESKDDIYSIEAPKTFRVKIIKHTGSFWYKKGEIYDVYNYLNFGYCHGKKGAFVSVYKRGGISIKHCEILDINPDLD